jgi:hypothetical protein
MMLPYCLMTPPMDLDYVVACVRESIRGTGRDSPICRPDGKATFISPSIRRCKAFWDDNPMPLVRRLAYDEAAESWVGATDPPWWQPAAGRMDYISVDRLARIGVHVPDAWGDELAISTIYDWRWAR